MRLVVHLCRLLYEAGRFGVSTRRLSVLIIVLLSLAFLALSFTAQTVAPLALYPFA
ncbi:MAG: hypothetical protein JWM47_981 [Acidimicrobiales bacterium]|nr:hypothetical protein [Acidimicrobiales bacterium]